MKPISAYTLTFHKATLNGHPMIFSDMRVDRNTIPTGLFAYDLRHSDEDWGEPVTIEKDQVIVNYYGTLISDQEIIFTYLAGDGDYLVLDGSEDLDIDWGNMTSINGYQFREEKDK